LGGIIYSLIKPGHFSFIWLPGFSFFIRPYLHLHLFIDINAIISLFIVNICPAIH